MKTLLAHVEPALAYAQAELAGLEESGGPDSFAQIHAALEAVRAARQYLELHRAPVYAAYDPEAALAPLLQQGSRRMTFLDSVSECVGDPEQVRLAIETVLANAVLELDALLVVQLLEEDEVPQVRVAFDGPGRFPEPFSVDGLIEMPFDELAARWTAATRGGRIDRTSYGLALRLKGVRVVPESKAELDAHVAPLREAEDRLNQPSPGIAEARAAVEGVLEALEEDGRGLEPGNVCALVEEVAVSAKPELHRIGIAVETLCDRNVPPVAMRRERLRSFFANAFRLAAASLASGGAVSLLIDYDVRSRAVGIVATLDGLKPEARASVFLASMRRVIVEGHGGDFQYETTRGRVAITATLPDPVARQLDAWIPGWDAFGDRSRQVLRLLRSGGPTPPEEFLLEGVLEEELEHWLLPRLETPLAINLSHELSAAASDLPGSSAERLEKALGQVRKRKPRKEIARPPYAAELLWAFRGDDRRRSALGTEKLDDDELRALCTALLRRPPDYITALQMLARMRRN